MIARAPASSANLGPGFDALGLALGLWVEVEVQEAPALEVTTSGQGAELPADASHLAVQVVTRLRGHSRFRIRVHSDIPVGRGLGSSAALAVAAAGAAGADREEALSLGTAWDGHPENAAASVYGGLVGASVIAGQPVVSPLTLDPRLGFVVLVPDRSLATEAARAALPERIPHVDARFNLGRLALLLAGLSDADRLRPEAGEDRLHQGYRAHLFPEAPQLLADLVAAGARLACWSGAGPSLLAVTGRADVEGMRQAGEEMLGRAGVAGQALALEADRRGLVVQSQ